VSKTSYWLGVLVLALALLAHAALPRYEVQPVPGRPLNALRTDRWTGDVELLTLR
jgi:hypothetical protein